MYANFHTPYAFFLLFRLEQYCNANEIDLQSILLYKARRRQEQQDEQTKKNDSELLTASINSKRRKQSTADLQHTLEHQTKNDWFAQNTPILQTNEQINVISEEDMSDYVQEVMTHCNYVQQQSTNVSLNYSQDMKYLQTLPENFMEEDEIEYSTDNSSQHEQQRLFNNCATTYESSVQIRQRQDQQHIMFTNKSSTYETALQGDQHLQGNQVSTHATSRNIAQDVLMNHQSATYKRSNKAAKQVTFANHSSTYQTLEQPPQYLNPNNDISTHLKSILPVQHVISMQNKNNYPPRKQQLHINNNVNGQRTSPPVSQHTVAMQNPTTSIQSNKQIKHPDYYKNHNSYQLAPRKGPVINLSNHLITTTTSRQLQQQTVSMQTAKISHRSNQQRKQPVDDNHNSNDDGSQPTTHHLNLNEQLVKEPIASQSAEQIQSNDCPLKSLEDLPNVSSNPDMGQGTIFMKKTEEDMKNFLNDCSNLCIPRTQTQFTADLLYYYKWSTYRNIERKRKKTPTFSKLFL